MNNNQTITKDKGCYICKNNIKDVDYKDVDLMKKFITSYAKIMPKKRSGTCAKHQRQVARAIKNSRIMGFLPFVIE